MKTTSRFLGILNTMSDLRRSVISAKLAKLYQLETATPYDEDDEERETDSLGPLPGFSETYVYTYK